MNRRSLRWIAPLLVAGLLPLVAEAAPAWVSKAPQSKTARADLSRASSAYNRARVRFEASKSLVQRQNQRFQKTSNPQQKEWAQANGLKAAHAKVDMLKAQARGLKAKAKIAMKAGRVAEANGYLDKADQLSKRAEKMGGAVAKVEAKRAAGVEPGKKAPKAQVIEPVAAMQADDGEGAPGVDGPAKAQLRGIASRQGKQTAKLQLESGNINGAMATLQRMEAQANRRGLMGVVDRYRKWSTKNTIYKQSYKMGKTGARAGDVQLASDAVNAMTAIGKDRWGNKGKISAIATQAVKGARQFAKSHRPEESRALLDLAQSIQKFQGREKPTLRYRFVRWSAKRSLMKDIKLRAEQGNMEAFRSAMRLASAYAKEDGRELKPGELGQIKKLYITALKNSVVRSLDDAKALLSGRMGYVNPEEAASRYLYAMETHEKLAQRGVKISTGLFHKGVKSKFAAVRAGLVKAQESGMHEVKRPGFVKRVLQKLFVAEHKRVQPGIAPVDSKWMARQQRAQQMEMERMAAAQEGPDMMEGATN